MKRKTAGIRRDSRTRTRTENSTKTSRNLSIDHTFQGSRFLETNKNFNFLSFFVIEKRARDQTPPKISFFDFSVVFLTILGVRNRPKTKKSAFQETSEKCSFFSPKSLYPQPDLTRGNSSRILKNYLTVYPFD